MVVRSMNDQCDVSLISSDGYVMQCQQAMLAASSGWFNKVLSFHRHEHPTLVLSDVSLKQLKLLLNYVYNGSMNVSTSDDFERFKKKNLKSREHEVVFHSNIVPCNNTILWKHIQLCDIVQSFLFMSGESKQNNESC